MIIEKRAADLRQGDVLSGDGSVVQSVSDVSETWHEVTVWTLIPGRVEKVGTLHEDALVAVYVEEPFDPWWGDKAVADVEREKAARREDRAEAEAFQAKVDATPAKPTGRERTYVVGFGDAVRHACSGDGGYDDALVESAQWTLSDEYLLGYRDGAAWAEGAA